MTLRADGFYSMHCWNGLNPTQQVRLIEVGNLPFGFVPDGWCDRPADLGIETRWDESPGERFYCLACAIQYLADVERSRRSDPEP